MLIERLDKESISSDVISACLRAHWNLRGLPGEVNSLQRRMKSEEEEAEEEEEEKEEEEEGTAARQERIRADEEIQGRGVSYRRDLFRYLSASTNGTATTAGCGFLQLHRRISISVI